MSSRDKKPSKPSTSRTGGIRTISDLNRPSAHDSDSDSAGPQEYYTGGEKSIRNSECPKELEPADRRSSVHVNLVRKDENCPEPELRVFPFQGVGRTLGSSSVTESAPESTVASTLLSAPAPSSGLVMDKSLPSTSIQLRLADGTRIADVRSFIDASGPGGSRSYQLQGTDSSYTDNRRSRVVEFSSCSKALNEEGFLLTFGGCHFYLHPRVSCKTAFRQSY